MRGEENESRSSVTTGQSKVCDKGACFSNRRSWRPETICFSTSVGIWAERREWYSRIASIIARFLCLLKGSKAFSFPGLKKSRERVLEEIQEFSYSALANALSRKDEGQVILVESGLGPVSMVCRYGPSYLIRSSHTFFNDCQRSGRLGCPGKSIYTSSQLSTTDTWGPNEFVLIRCQRVYRA